MTPATRHSLEELDATRPITEAHYRILELAEKAELGSDPKPWVDLYVYPRSVDEVVALGLTRLQRRATLLRANPGKASPPLEDLVIPAELALKTWVYSPQKDRSGLTAPVV